MEPLKVEEKKEQAMALVEAQETALAQRFTASDPDDLVQIEEPIDEGESELRQRVAGARVEIKRLSEEMADNEPPSWACRWHYHAYIALSPTDDEHAELCRLLGRSRASLNMENLKDITDRVCFRCGHIDAALQRFLISLRRLRNAARVRMQAGK